jgi:hypothetical protein
MDRTGAGVLGFKILFFAEGSWQGWPGWPFLVEVHGDQEGMYGEEHSQVASQCVAAGASLRLSFGEQGWAKEYARVKIFFCRASAGGRQAGRSAGYQHGKWQVANPV